MNARRWLFVVLVVGTLIPGLSMADEPKSAAEALKKGEQLLSAGDSDGAIAAYTEAIRLNPKNFLATAATSGSISTTSIVIRG